MENNTTITAPEKVAITLNLPNPKSVALKFKNKIITFFSNIYNPIRHQASETGETVNSTFRKARFPKFNFNRFNNKKAAKIVLPLLIGVVLISGIIAFIRSVPDAQSTPITQQESKNNVLSSKPINKTLNFPIADNKGEEVGQFEFTITDAELRDKIVVQGRNASAVDGRVFLIFNLKIKNNINQPLQLNTRDYIRVTVASNTSEKLAADIHNDPVEVQAISTKYTRVGLAIDAEDSQKPIKVQIGEINGSKQIIELKFN